MRRAIDWTLGLARLLLAVLIPIVSACSDAKQLSRDECIEHIKLYELCRANPDCRDGANRFGMANACGLHYRLAREWLDAESAARIKYPAPIAKTAVDRETQGTVDAVRKARREMIAEEMAPP